jgi:lysozyme
MRELPRTIHYSQSADTRGGRALMNIYDYSSTGLALTRSFEGLRLEAYQDCAGIWTIGYGHTGPEVRAGQRITEPQAEALLRQDLAAAVHCVRGAVKAPITQHQFDALVDFCFNAGRGNLLSSSLLRDINRGEFSTALAQFALWVHAGARVLPGLVRRRAAEAALFAGQGFPATTPPAQAGTSPDLPTAPPPPSTEVAVAEPGTALASTARVTIA